MIIRYIGFSLLDILFGLAIYRIAAFFDLPYTHSFLHLVLWVALLHFIPVLFTGRSFGHRAFGMIRVRGVGVLYDGRQQFHRNIFSEWVGYLAAVWGLLLIALAPEFNRIKFFDVPLEPPQSVYCLMAIGILQLSFALAVMRGQLLPHLFVCALILAQVLSVITVSPDIETLIKFLMMEIKAPAGIAQSVIESLGYVLAAVVIGIFVGAGIAIYHAQRGFIATENYRGDDMQGS